jgi:LysM domain
VYDRTDYGSNEGLIMEVTMNAMPAMTRPCGSGIRPRHGGAAHPEHRPRRDLGLGGASGITPRATPAGALRLTRRGRLVAAALAALLVTVVSLLAAGAAQATNHALPSGAARQNLVHVIVRPGQSLWSVAEGADPDQDTRAVIQQIVDLNALSGDVVFAGQQLWVPRG